MSETNPLNTLIEDHYGELVDESRDIRRAESRMLKKTSSVKSLSLRKHLRNTWYARCLGMSLDDLLERKAKVKKGRSLDELRFWRRSQRLRPTPNIPLAMQDKGTLENRFFSKFSGELCSVELECIFPDSTNKPRNSAALSPYLVKMCDDGSICYSRPSREGSDGEESSTRHSTAEIKVTFRSQRPLRLQSVVEKLRERGAIVNVSCGTHAHFDMRGRSFRDASKLAKRLIKCLPALSKLVARSRLGNRYAELNRPVMLGKRYCHTRSRYHAINFRAAFSKWRTIENRLHGGTLDFWKIIGWVDLSNWIMQSKEVDRVAMARAQAFRHMRAKDMGWQGKPSDLQGDFPMQILVEDLIQMETLPEHLRVYVWTRYRNFYPADAALLEKQLIADGKVRFVSPPLPAKRNPNKQEEE